MFGVNFKKVNILVFVLVLLVPILLFAHPKVQLLDENGNPIINSLDKNDKIIAPNGSVYYRGPAYSPKMTCGKCHDYNSVTKAYHFREGAGPNGEDLSDLWVSERRGVDPLNKYLTNAYGHLLSPGQYGAW